MAESDAFIVALKELSASVGLSLSAAEIAALHTHHQLLGKWAKKMNLTSVTEDVASARLHFVDSLLFAHLLPESVDGRVVDVGSGAGFPGMVLAVVRPDLQWTLLEPTRKRASFLRVVRADLGLDEVEILEGRLEEQPEASNLGSVPGAIVSRATLPPPDLVRRAAHHLKPGGCLLASGGAKYPSVAELETEQMRHDERQSYDLGNGVQRTLDRFVRQASPPSS